MNLELLKTELARAEEAELQSEEQLRQMPDLIDKAAMPNAAVNASDCAKLVAAVLSVNERLRDRTMKLRSAVLKAEMDAEDLPLAERIRRMARS